MSRTRRKYEWWRPWFNGFDKVLARDNHHGVIRNPDDAFDFIYGRYRKRKAKRRMAKRHRLKNKEELKDNLL